MGLQSLQISPTFRFSFIFTLLPCDKTLLSQIAIHGRLVMTLISHFFPVQTYHNNYRPTFGNFFGESKEIQSKLDSIILALW